MYSRETREQRVVRRRHARRHRHASTCTCRTASRPARTAALLALGYTDHETAGNAVHLERSSTATRFSAARTRVYGLAGSGFRAPDATDRYGFGGNPDLEPERSRNYEVGVRHALDGAHSRCRSSAFRNDIDDLIDFVVAVVRPVRRREPRTSPRRASRASRPPGSTTRPPWQARVEAIYQDPRNLTDDEQLLRRARATASPCRAQRALRPGRCSASTCSPPASARTSAFRSR